MERYIADNQRYEQMKYRRCGHSGVMLPEVSLGFWHNFGGTDVYEHCRETARYAFDHGVVHFDLANNYGPPYGSAEETMGRLMDDDFRPYRDELFISSKAGYDMWPGPYGDWGSRKYLMASIDQSLKRMKIDYVDLFYSHRYDPNTPLEETLQALVDIVRQGKALYVGISRWPLEALKIADKYLSERDVPLLIFQDKLNMLNREPQEQGILDYCADNHRPLSERYSRRQPHEQRQVPTERNADTGTAQPTEGMERRSPGSWTVAGRESAAMDSGTARSDLRTRGRQQQGAAGQESEVHII